VDSSQVIVVIAMLVSIQVRVQPYVRTAPRASIKPLPVLVPVWILAHLALMDLAATPQPSQIVVVQVTAAHALPEHTLSILAPAPPLVVLLAVLESIPLLTRLSA